MRLPFTAAIVLAMSTMQMCPAATLSPSDIGDTYNYPTAGGYGPGIAKPIYDTSGVKIGDGQITWNTPSGPILEYLPGGTTTWLWVKYDLADISGDVKSAFISSEINWVYHNDNEYRTHVHYVHDDNWYSATVFGGDGICWNNQPTDYEATSLDSVAATSVGTYSWDVTSAVQDAMANDKVVSFLFRYSQDKYPDYNTDFYHYGDYAATSFVTSSVMLNIDTPPVPEPTSLALWSGLGVMGLVAARRRRRLAA